MNSYGIRVLKWAPYSPDLNGMENAWFLLDKEKNKQIDKLIREGRKLPANKYEMFLFLKRCWSKINNLTIKKIYFSFLKRIIMVKKNKGKNSFSTRISLSDIAST